jgi:hypothetical protein
MAQQPKPWYKSRTINLNALTTIVVVLTALQGQSFVSEHPRISLGITAAVSIANIILRTITTQPVS